MKKFWIIAAVIAVVIVVVWYVMKKRKEKAEAEAKAKAEADKNDPATTTGTELIANFSERPQGELSGEEADPSITNVRS